MTGHTGFFARHEAISPLKKAAPKILPQKNKKKGGKNAAQK